MSGEPRSKLDGIQYLRALAALMVVYWHASAAIPAYTTALRGTNEQYGPWHFNVGVDIFFVVSGFIMVVTSQRIGPAVFAWRRIVRIVPLYWGATLALVAGSAILPAAFQSTKVSAPMVVKSLLFIAYHKSATEVLPLLVPGWTLNLEMCFYAVFALALLKPLREHQLPFVGAIFGGLVVIGLNLPNEHSILWFYCQPIILLFWVGMVLGTLYVRGIRLVSVLACYTLIVAGLMHMLTPLAHLWHDHLLFIIGPTLLVFGIVCLERANALPKIPGLVAIGDASYSLYLTHLFVINLLRVIWMRLHIGTDEFYALGFAAIAIVGSLAVSFASYQMIEKPTLGLLRRFGERNDRQNNQLTGLTSPVSVVQPGSGS